MSAHPKDDQSVEMVLGARGGDHIRLEVLGRTCPDADTDWYRSQVNATIHVHIETFRGFRSLVMFSNNFHHFRAELSSLAAAEAAVATLETSDFLSIDLRAGGSGFEVWMQLDALEEGGALVLRDGGAENWEWRLTMDRASLDALIDAVTRISNLYAT